MARKVDITDKLSFEGNPSLVIKGKAIEVNADAPTMLKVMGLMSANDPGKAHPGHHGHSLGHAGVE